MPWSPRVGALHCFWVDILVHETRGRSCAYFFSDLVRPRVLVGFLGQGASQWLLSQVLPGICRGGDRGLHTRQFCWTPLSATHLFSYPCCVVCWTDPSLFENYLKIGFTPCQAVLTTGHFLVGKLEFCQTQCSRSHPLSLLEIAAQIGRPP